MRRTILVAGLVAAVATPSFASARTVCEQRAHEHKVVGTVLGAGVGALVGNAITNDTGGTILGGVGGAVVGNQLARSKCYSYRTSSRTRYYRSAPTGYYDNASYRDGPARCSYETRPYYNERGELIYAPTQVCR